MKIAALQMCSGLEPEPNLKKIRKFLEEAKVRDVQAVFLPECFYSMSDGTKPSPYLVEGQNEHYENIRSLAKDSELYILGGSAATRMDEQVVNRNYNFSPEGIELTSYDKMNLFAIKVGRENSDQVANVDEASIYKPGTRSQILEVGPLKIGLSICFDLRFPEMYRQYSLRGANVLSISSAFTRFTGRAHWHTLVRARAIENQCYVVAAAQWGQHNSRVTTYGYSLIVDPWGEIIADAEEGEKLIYGEINLKYLDEIRSRMDVLK